MFLYFSSLLSLGCTLWLKTSSSKDQLTTDQWGSLTPQWPSTLSNLQQFISLLFPTNQSESVVYYSLSTYQRALSKICVKLNAVPIIFCAKLNRNNKLKMFLNSDLSKTHGISTTTVIKMSMFQNILSNPCSDIIKYNRLDIR